MCKVNIRLNDCTDRVIPERIAWGDYSEELLNRLGKFDTIIGSEVVYRPTDLDILLETAQAFFAPEPNDGEKPPRMIFAFGLDPSRQVKSRQPFIDKAKDFGFETKIVAKHPEKDIELLEFRRCGP
eukprot:Rmarinus@m.9909